MSKYIGLDGIAIAPLELEFEVDSILFKGAVLISNPPPGAFKVINIFVNSKGRVQLEYDDTPCEV